MDRKLSEIQADRKKIVLYMAMRLPWLALFGLAILAADMQRLGKGSPNYAATGVMLLLMLIYVCSPLRHLADVLTYYENKIVFNKKEILFQDPSELCWIRLGGRYQLLRGTRLI